MTGVHVLGKRCRVLCRVNQQDFSGLLKAMGGWGDIWGNQFGVTDQELVAQSLFLAFGVS